MSDCKQIEKMNWSDDFSKDAPTGIRRKSYNSGRLIVFVLVPLAEKVIRYEEGGAVAVVLGPFGHRLSVIDFTGNVY